MIVGCCVAVRCRALPCVAVRCSVLQCVAVCCSVRVVEEEHTVYGSRLWQCCVCVVCWVHFGSFKMGVEEADNDSRLRVAVCVCVAVCCSVWQRVAVCICVGCILEDLKLGVHFGRFEMGGAGLNFQRCMCNGGLHVE